MEKGEWLRLREAPHGVWAYLPRVESSAWKGIGAHRLRLLLPIAITWFFVPLASAISVSRQALHGGGISLLPIHCSCGWYCSCLPCPTTVACV